MSDGVFNVSATSESDSYDELFNTTADNTTWSSSGPSSLREVIPMTILYTIIFLLGTVGNMVTCVVIVKNSYMHTATNYYLFSMSVSDLLLLITGLPLELHSFWAPGPPYVFGETFCVLRGQCAETSTNASILTIVFFTVERYMAICHPLRQQAMSSLPRTLRNVALVWTAALVCASFPASQFGIRYDFDERGEPLAETAECTVVRNLFPCVFEVATFLFFVVPMLLITVLYVRIGLRLRCTTTNRGLPRESVHGGRSGGAISARRAVIKMLVAVVVAFFICWAPFHSQRLIASNASTEPSATLRVVMKGLHHVSGVLFYVSTCINPILYHIMSARFRQAVRDTFGKGCQRVCCGLGGGDLTRPTQLSATEVTGLATPAEDLREKEPELRATNSQDNNTHRAPLLSDPRTAVSRI